MMTFALVLTLAGTVFVLVAVRRVRRNGWRPVRAAPAMAVRARRQIRAHVPHMLYRYEWVTGGDSYYGISNEPERRHGRHLTDPEDEWWMVWSRPVMIPVAWMPDRATAQAAERAAIRAACARGAVLANTHHNPRPIRRGSHVRA